MTDRKAALGQRNLYDELIAMRDQWRREMQDSISVVRFEELPWETNPQGIMRWYLHPALTDVSLRMMVFLVQRIPGASRSGKQRVQGGQAIYVWAGRGYTEINGARHHWEEGDLINLPLVTEGVVFQHFNSSADSDVLLATAEPNYTQVFGVDMGSGFEQLENAPEYGP